MDSTLIFFSLLSFSLIIYIKNYVVHLCLYLLGSGRNSYSEDFMLKHS